MAATDIDRLRAYKQAYRKRMVEAAGKTYVPRGSRGFTIDGDWATRDNKTYDDPLGVYEKFDREEAGKAPRARKPFRRQRFGREMDMSTIEREAKKVITTFKHLKKPIPESELLKRTSLTEDKLWVIRTMPRFELCFFLVNNVRYWGPRYLVAKLLKAGDTSWLRS